jgi:hypothetical protein
MTVKQLITELLQFPSDAKIEACCSYNTRDPAGMYAITDVYSYNIGDEKRVYLTVDDD